MQVNLINCLFILDSEKNENIRKNEIKKIKVLVNKNNELPSTCFTGNNMKEEVQKNISSIIGSNIFHLEQVFTMDYEDSIDVIYLGITNTQNVSNLDDDYKLIDFAVKNNDTIIFGDNEYKYKTVEIISNNNAEYIHEISTDDNAIERTLLNILISYKRIRSNIDNSDIIFKFMGDTFTLEDVRIVYEIIKDTTIDKSNFRKKIIKYCEKTEDKEKDGNGFRPSQKYKFKPLKGDAWI